MGYGSRHRLLAGWLAAAVAAVGLAAWLRTSERDAASQSSAAAAPTLATKKMFDAGGTGVVDGIAPARGSVGTIGSATSAASGWSGAIWAAVETPGLAAPASSGALVFCGADGRTAKFPLPTPSSVPAFPVVATDGAVWFVYQQGTRWRADPSVTGPVLDHETEAMARLAPDGMIERFDTLPGDEAITTTVAGSDGTAWFLAYDESAKAPAPDLTLGHVWPDGHSTMRPLQGEMGGNMAGLFVSDGAVWITAPGAMQPSAKRIDRDASSPIDVNDPGPWMLTDNADHIVELNAAGNGILTAGLEGQPASSLAPDGQGGFWLLVDRYPASSAPDTGASDTGASDTGRPSLLHLHIDGSLSWYTPDVPPSKFQGPYWSYAAVASDGVPWLTVGSTVYRTALPIPQPASVSSASRDSATSSIHASTPRS